MSVRRTLVIPGLALAALIGWACLRPKRSPDAPTPAAPGVAAPAPAAGPAPAVAPRSLKPTITRNAPPPTMAEQFRMRRRVGSMVEAALKDGGPREAWRVLKDRIEDSPADPRDQRDRIFAFRYLPAVVAKDAALRDEVLGLLRRHLTDDADPAGRLASAAVLADVPISFNDPAGDGGYFWVRGIPQEPGSDALDEQVLSLGFATDAALRGLVQGAFAREPESYNRMYLLQLLAMNPGAPERGFFEDVLQRESHPETRDLALDALAELPPSSDSLAALRRAMQGDPEPALRRKALSTLVAQGAVDDLVISTLLAAPPVDRAGWQVLGRAWSVSKAPALGASLRGGLESPDPNLRGGALVSIHASGDKSFLPFVEAARAKESDESLKKLYPKVLEALAK